MPMTTEHFITQMKLHELRRQRDRLRHAYTELQQQIAGAPDSAARLQYLYESLLELKFADQPLHPQVANLDVLLKELEMGHADPLSVAYWLGSLERQLAIGHQRAEFAYLFGVLLEEWTQATDTSNKGMEHVRIRREEVARLRDPVPPMPYADFLEPLVAEIAKNIEFKPDYDPLRRAMDAHYLSRLLGEIRNDRFRPAPIRRQAERFMNDPQILNEFSDALTIMIDNLDDWTWSEVGVPVYVQRVGDRWRLFLDEDLPTAVLLQALGERWLLMELFHSEGCPGDAFWASAEGVQTGMAEGRTNFQGDTGSIVQLRRAEHGGLLSAVWQVNYSREGYSGGLELSVRFLNAEIRLWQAAFPDKPLYILKVDLKDFYPSLSHAMLAWMLDRIGYPEKDRAFIDRFLPLQLQVDGETVVTRRGLPNDRVLAHNLGEMVLWLLDEHVAQAAPVEIIRVVDDIAILAASLADVGAAWEAIQAFCDATGLEINMAKSGSVCLGGERAEGLPENLPTWKLLQLHPDGEWRIDWGALERRRSEARAEVEAAASVLMAVETYNANIREVLDNLALNTWLGDLHREQVSEALAAFHYEFFDDRRGIADHIRAMLRSCFLDDDEAMDIPEAWLYWPLTAGGLGLLHPMVEAISYAKKIEDSLTLQLDPPTERRDDWQERSNRWSTYYRRLLGKLMPAQPEQTKVMDTLVNDFIQRGTQMSGQHQRTLSPYWRWVLHTFGPQIIDWFGSFRFLITELVPLQLILQSRRQALGAGLGSKNPSTT